MKYGVLAVVLLGLVMPSVAEAGRRERSEWGFSVNIGYSEGYQHRSRYPASYSRTHISYRSSTWDYQPPRYRPVYCPPPVVYCPPPPPPVVYCPPVYRQVEYEYYAPTRVRVREVYPSYSERDYRYDTGATITYRSSGYQYRR